MIKTYNTVRKDDILPEHKLLCAVLRNAVEDAIGVMRGKRDVEDAKRFIFEGDKLKGFLSFWHLPMVWVEVIRERVRREMDEEVLLDTTV